MRYFLIFTVAFGLSNCADETLVADYKVAEDCFQMNAELIEPTEDDPHQGYKNVYACNVTPEELRDEAGAPVFPYPEGTLIIKESTRENQDYRWLIATAEKKGGNWEWKEFTRNFANEEFAKLPVSEDTCVNCHNKVKALDYIYTIYSP